MTDPAGRPAGEPAAGAAPDASPSTPRRTRRAGRAPAAHHAAPPGHAGDGSGRATALRLARLHLRLGQLPLARAQLEALAGRAALDEGALLDLAEARWRTGDLAGAGEAAGALLARGRDDALALLIVAESVAAVGRPGEARPQSARAQAMIEGPLRWFGAVEFAYDGKELAAFQVTPLGAWLFSETKAGSYTGTAPAEEAGAEAIRWLDDSTLRLRATSDAVRVMPLVRAFADPTRELLTFRVSNDSLARAFEKGIAVAEIAAKFAEMGAPLPSALRARMDALEANYGRIHLYEHLTVLELADDMALRELLAGTSLSQYIVHQFSPRVVIVREEGVDELANELVKKGYTPRVTHGYR